MHLAMFGTSMGQIGLVITLFLDEFLVFYITARLSRMRSFCYNTDKNA